MLSQASHLSLCHYQSLCFKTETCMHTLLFSFQCLGVIYGQLSSAPLYVFGTVHQKEFVSDETTYGLFSFIFWTMTIISLLKYALLVQRADDDGEGGTFALYSILCRHAKVGLLPSDTSAKEVMQYEEESPFKTKVESRARRAIAKHKSSHYLMLFLALFSACIAISDGVLTPSLFVLSASTGFGRTLASIKFSHSEHIQERISKALKEWDFQSI
ncbi:potassium transporter 2-like [Humulus lupulus]|uniref:potassium transporter 2-like n=1 Tax=Humulus lupulus TaxID=3486 RepID=UPI002B41126A|nr:potassium transporter 2-like [Humulus lupulus]